MKLYVNKGRPDDAFELYDLRNDPSEKQNIADKKQHVVDTLHRKLRQLLDTDPFPKIESQFPDWIDQEKREKIIKEGYF